MNDSLNWGIVLRNARKEAGLTQKQLAEKMGTTISFVSQYENGYRIPKPETLERFSVALDSSFTQDIGQQPEVSSCDELKLIDIFRTLNDTGKQEALKRIRELAELNKYKK